jgi:RHH-type proline utilization regulon transcriptional repressor/proline dehydrogenase/delta 1-pyrroline-5-carboxylate dehydrogenase
VLCIPATKTGLYNQISLALSGGNTALILADASISSWYISLPDAIRTKVKLVASATAEPCAIVLSERDDAAFAAARQTLAGSNTAPIASAWITGNELPSADCVLEEQSRSINTTAAGGNASLMTLG